MRIPTVAPLILGWSLSCVPVAAQGMGVTYFGAGCSNNPFTPPGDQRVVGTPRLGQRLSLEYLGGNRSSTCTGIGCVQQPVLLAGLSNVRFGNIQLPFQLPGLCPLRVSVQVLQPMPLLPNGRFQDKLIYDVPRDLELVGRWFFVQWLTIGGTNLLASSPGARIEFGR